MSESQNKGFSGMLDRIRLMDLVQVASIGQMSADLEISSATGNGLITIRSGQVVHCETGAMSGEEALRRVLSWTGGSFEFRPPQFETRQSIELSWEQLLMESILNRIEAGVDQAQSESGFSGRIFSMDFLALAELACLSLEDRVLRIHIGENEGAVFFNSAGICHAEYRRKSGESAFKEMAPAEGGTFSSDFPQGDGPVTIERPWDELLVEAKKHRDEMRAGVPGIGLTNYLQQIQRMKLIAKIRLALSGPKEARMLLAREGNKLVQLAVMANPKLSEFEVALIASSRSTDEEVFRKIASNREWMRLHQVREALVNNPKCPIPIASKVIETLGYLDWKKIAASKSVASVVSAAAKRLISKKTGS